MTRVIGAASFARAPIDPEDIVVVEVLVKDIVAQAGPLRLFIAWPDLVTAFATDRSHAC